MHFTVQNMDNLNNQDETIQSSVNLVAVNENGDITKNEK